MGLFTDWEPKGDYNQQSRAIREEKRKEFEKRLKAEFSAQGLEFSAEGTLNFSSFDEIKECFPNCTLAVNDPDIGLQLIGETHLYRICATLRKPFIDLGEFFPNDKAGTNWHELI